MRIYAPIYVQVTDGWEVYTSRLHREPPVKHIASWRYTERGAKNVTRWKKLEDHQRRKEGDVVQEKTGGKMEVSEKRPEMKLFVPTLRNLQGAQLKVC